MPWFPRPESSIDEVEPAEASERIAAGEGVLLDVRDPHEWAAGHAVGARHIPLPFLASRASELPADETVYVICASGSRSRTAAAMLARSGVKAINVKGGLHAWLRSGLAATRD